MTGASTGSNPMRSRTTCHIPPYIVEQHYMHGVLHEQEHEEPSMVKFPDASAYPEAMVIKLGHAGLAVPAMLASVVHHSLANLTILPAW
jgi:hypothetical protein